MYSQPLPAMPAEEQGEPAAAAVARERKKKNLERRSTVLRVGDAHASRSWTNTVSVFPSPSSAKLGGSGHSRVGSQGSVRRGKFVMISKLLGASAWQNT